MLSTMKERGSQPNQGNHELIASETGLTQEALNPTLGGGDIFMAEPGQGEQPPMQPDQAEGPKTVEETVRHLARIRVEGEKAITLGPDGLPLEFGSWPTAIRKAWMDKQRDSAGTQFLDQQITQREDPHAISPAQKEALDSIYPVLDDNPEAFADSYKRAIDTLSEKRGEPIVHKDIDSLFERTIQTVQGRISPESEKRFRKQLAKVKLLTFAEATRAFEKLVGRVVKEPENEPKRREAAAVRKAKKAAEAAIQQTEPATPEAVAEETQDVQPQVASGEGGQPPIPPEAPPTGPAPEGEPVPPAPHGEPVQEEAAGPQERAEDLIRRYMQERELRYQSLTSPIREFLSDPEFIRSCEEQGIHPPGPDDVVKHILDGDKLERVVSERFRGREREQIIIPRSLEDLARLVMGAAAPEWREGEKALIYKFTDENGVEHERVNTLNFLEWARNNYIKVHLNNPTAPVNFFSDIATNVRSEGYGAVISFYEMTFTEGYFLREERDEQGRVTDFVEDEEYKALQSQMLMEVFLLQLNRNPAITHLVQTRAEREKMINNLIEAFAGNPLTRSDFFERIFTMPSMQVSSQYDLDPRNKGRELQAKLEGNFAMGDATREALAAYMNIFDYKQLVQIFGADSPLFKYEYQEHDGWSAKAKDEHSKNSSINDSKRMVWFHDDGSVRLYAVDRNGKYRPRKGPDGKELKDSDGNMLYEEDSNGSPHPGFMKHINIFLSPSPDQRQQGEIREKIRLSIMQSNEISYREAQIAELMAYSIAQINGVAARQDLDSVGFDWWTRVQNFLDKRKREKSPNRNAPYGSEFNMEGFRRIGLNMMEAVRDAKGRSLRHIIQGGKDEKDERVDIKGNKLKKYEIVDYEKDQNGVYIFRDHKGKALYRNGNGVLIDQSRVATQHEIDENNNIVFRDANGNVVEVGEARPRLITSRVGEQVSFKQDIQKQFFPNHLIVGSEIYEWIMRKKELALPELVTGYDAHGNPILNWEKINEIKGTIEHHFRYLLSTWGEINYGERNLEWERVEERDTRRRLIAEEKDASGNDVYLDEDWYILDSKGRKTDKRAEPRTYVRSMVMSRLENMFGAPALKYIQFEIENRGLNEGNDVIEVKDPRTGKIVKVNISAASGSEKDKSEFKLAVWQGAFDYLIAAEIESHRTRNSGERYYNFFDMLKAKQALEMGQILERKQIKSISRETKTTDAKLFSQELGFAASIGATEGILKSLKKFFSSAVTGQ